MKLLVGESSGATGEDVDCAAHCKTDFSDLRFTTADGTTLLDYWIESLSGTTPNQLATVWVEFDSIGTGATTFYIYYGNAGATAVSSGADTFIAYDDFERGSDGDTVGGNWVEVAAHSHISTDHAWNGTRCLKMVGGTSPGCYIPVTVGNVAISFRIWKEDATGVNYFWLGNGSRIIYPYVQVDEAIYYNDGSPKSAGASITPDAWEQIEFRNMDYSSAFIFDIVKNGVVIKSGAGMLVSAATANRFNISIDEATAGRDVYFDSFIVRQFLATEPAWGSWGAEQTEDEEPTVTIVSVVTCEDVLLTMVEEVLSVIAGLVTCEDLQNYIEIPEALVIIGIVKSLLADPRAPAVKGRKPRPGETAVITNQPVQFYVCSETDDGVDISTVEVTIGGVTYDYSDPEFSYSGSPEAYLISVQHPDWSNEQTVTVVIAASSLCGEAMTPVTYTFETEWVSTKDRTGYGKVELYEAGGDYGYNILTLEEDWVRQGTERYSPELEVWWGRYQRLPYIENLDMRVEAGITNRRGKEILDNGYLSVKVDDGSYVPLFAATTIDLGPMFTHTHRSLFFKLLIPEGAATTKYFVLDLIFEPQMFFPYGRFRYGRGIYQNAGNMIEMSPNNHLYRSYVFNATMWNQLLAVGITASPVARGQDKKW